MRGQGRVFHVDISGGWGRARRHIRARAERNVRKAGTRFDVLAWACLLDVLRVNLALGFPYSVPTKYPRWESFPRPSVVPLPSFCPVMVGWQRRQS